ncbi:helix-turn-helix domain-containing protein [uncultured Nitratireductor sp.]|uniref:S24 family peptidase n=1 Tax=uncultured Nitratireductor sp. TaxID=520953 RepID=UPI0025E761FF|nr:helix-turn-helix domain-containing protein [uncultured Nitratireductor sp.]
MTKRTETIGQRIRQARTQKELTQQDVADFFKISRVSVTQWEGDVTVPESEKFPRLAELLGGDAEWYLTGKGRFPISESLKNHVSSQVKADKPNATIGARVGASGVRIPVYGSAVGGLDGEFELNGSILYEVLAPPSLSPISGAYAVQVSGESMEPRYFDGEVVFVDPTRRVRRGDFVVAQVRLEPQGPLLAYIKRFIRHNAEELILEQYNPSKELRFRHENVHSVHFVVMGGVA